MLARPRRRVKSALDAPDIRAKLPYEMETETQTQLQAEDKSDPATITRAEIRPYQRLAAAIVGQATKDLITARNKCLLQEAQSIARFFHSPWYRFLCGIPAGKILKNLPAKNRRDVKTVLESIADNAEDSEDKKAIKTFSEQYDVTD